MGLTFQRNRHRSPGAIPPAGVQDPPATEEEAIEGPYASAPPTADAPTGNREEDDQDDPRTPSGEREQTDEQRESARKGLEAQAEQHEAAGGPGPAPAGATSLEEADPPADEPEAPATDHEAEAQGSEIVDVDESGEQAPEGEQEQGEQPEAEQSEEQPEVERTRPRVDDPIAAWRQYASELGHSDAEIAGKSKAELRELTKG